MREDTRTVKNMSYAIPISNSDSCFHTIVYALTSEVGVIDQWWMTSVNVYHYHVNLQTLRAVYNLDLTLNLHKKFNNSDKKTGLGLILKDLCIAIDVSTITLLHA